MPTRRKQPASVPEAKDLTLEDIESGIRKFKRRIDQVKAIDTAKTIYNAPEVQAATRNIQADLIDVFGKGSQEYYAHADVSVSYPEGHPGIYAEDGEIQHLFARGITRISGMLESLIKRLEEKREDLGADTTTRVRASFEGLDLHPRIAGACADLYRDEHYADAVLRASLALENFVKEKSGRYDLSGSTLMEQAFTPNGPVLAFNALADQTDKDEQRGMMLLFQGAVFAFRNPRAHKLLEDSPEEALEAIALISLLAKRLEQAKAVKK
jgi:uncharacterized protein (TIGR02391 family)